MRTYPINKLMEASGKDSSGSNSETKRDSVKSEDQNMQFYKKAIE